MRPRGRGRPRSLHPYAVDRRKGMIVTAYERLGADAATAAGLLRRGQILEAITLSWNVVGIIVLTFAAIRARSVALAGFGLDSLIEIGASRDHYVATLKQCHGSDPRPPGRDQNRRASRRSSAQPALSRPDDRPQGRTARTGA